MLAVKPCNACSDRSGLPLPFSMAFQPIVDLASGRIESHEALVRGVAGESARVILAQVTPEMIYSFDQACRVSAIRLAQRLGLTSRLSINFLPNAIYEPAACIRLTLAVAAEVGFPLDRITFEVTENERINDTAFMRRIFTTYRHHGFKLALDDFGTGHANLAVLLELEPDIIKIDRRLVAGADQNPRATMILSSLVGLAQRLGVATVAEGIETESELRLLQDLGVTYGQGFLLAKPAFERVLTSAELALPGGFA